MSKKIFSSITILSLLMVAGFVFAQDLNLPNGKTVDLPDQAKAEPPAVEGIYDVPGHPELKVRVFVHRDKPDKPGKPTPPPPEPSLVCPVDLNSLAVVGAAGWHLPAGNWTYRLNISSAPSSVRANFVTFTDRAFDEWEFKTEADVVNFVKGSNTSTNRARYDRQNIIAWGRAPASALAVTYIWYYTASGLVAEVDTIMNSRYPWTWTDQTQYPTCADENSYDAQNILTHELGHWVGLDDHYTGEYVNNTMYGYGSKGEAKKDTLTTGDIAGVDIIY